jgi:hypothetical protein
VLIIRSPKGPTRPLQENIWVTAATANDANPPADDMKEIIAPIVTVIATTTGTMRTVVKTETAIGAMTATVTAVARAQNTHLAVVTPVVLALVGAGAFHPAVIIESTQNVDTSARKKRR